MSASIRSRPSIIAGGPVVATAISAASRVNDQLILTLGAFPGEVTWLMALEAQTILRTEGCSIMRSSLRLRLPRRRRRETRCTIRGPCCGGSGTMPTVGDPDALVLI